MSAKKKENVLCVRAEVLSTLGVLEGLVVGADGYLDVITAPQHTCYVERTLAETSYHLKQIIPYLLVYSQGQILRYRRGRSGGEGRLHGLYSVGVGGHIAAEDRTLFSKDAVGYLDAMERELTEEVELHSPWRHACVGLINDNSTDVGRVHLGVVHIVELQTPDVVRKEDCLTKLEFVGVGVPDAFATEYEGWSQLCLKHWNALWDCAVPLLQAQDWRAPSARHGHPVGPGGARAE